MVCSAILETEFSVSLLQHLHTPKSVFITLSNELKEWQHNGKQFQFFKTWGKQLLHFDWQQFMIQILSIENNIIEPIIENGSVPERDKPKMKHGRTRNITIKYTTENQCSDISQLFLKINWRFSCNRYRIK